MSLQAARSLVNRLGVTGLHRYHRLPISYKAFIWAVVLFYALLGIFIIIATPSRVAQFLYDLAENLAATQYGWLIFFVASVVVSFPPLIGHTTVVTLCGFAFGMKGFWIAAPGALCGASFVFVLLRSFFGRRLRQWSANHKKWKGVEDVVRAKGLPLIILIRISPFPPWAYSNSLFPSINSVELWQFVVATLFIFPRVLLQVFIGSRIAALSDGGTRKMDPYAVVIDTLLVIGGIILSILSSWVIYSLVQKHIRHFEEPPSGVDELETEVLNDDEAVPFLDDTLQPTHSPAR